MQEYITLATESFWPILYAGLSFTLPLTLISFLLGGSLGFISALVRLYAPKPLRYIVVFYVWLIRGTPLLVQLFIIFYALPNVGITIDAFPAAIIGFSLNVGAYSSEVLRSALLSVSKGQWEAAHSISMSKAQCLWHIILPQAARTAIPPLSNTFISLIKDTSLASTITVPELFLSAQRIAAVTYQPLVLYVVAAAIYLLFCSGLTFLQSYLEAKLTWDKEAVQ